MRLLLPDSPADAPRADFTVWLLPRDDGGQPVERKEAFRLSARATAGEISRLLRESRARHIRLDGRPVEPRHIAVLCRTNVQARAVQRALAELSVPTVLEGDSSVFDQETAEELARVLWAIAEPADRRKLAAALSTAVLGVSG